MSFLLWQMPFTFFGFAVFGSAIIAATKSKKLNQNMEGYEYESIGSVDW